MKFIKDIVVSFIKDDCLNLAANISFCALLSLIPMAMMMVSIAGYFLGGSEDAFTRLVEVVSNILPVGREIFINNLQSILKQKSSLGIIGILFLIGIATILVSSIERALDKIFKCTNKRNFFHSRLLGIALIFWVTLLFALPTMTNILESLLNKYGFHVPLISLMSGKISFLIISFLAYIMTVVIIPSGKVYVRYAAVGGVFFAVGLGIAKFLFRSYMVYGMSRYNIIYGSLTAAVILVVWIYYLTVVLLLSAEFVSELQRRMLLHRSAKKGRRKAKS